MGGSVRVIEINNPPVNGLGAAVRSHLRNELERALADAQVEGVVITGVGKMFSAGADIREFGKEAPPGTPSLPEVIDAIERSPKPVVAAIHGVAAGGGLELALGCHARIASPETRLGLPEVTLGIIPGAGGTQRLPRLTGIREALGLITEGKLVPAAKAHALGFVDEVVTGDFFRPRSNELQRHRSVGRPNCRSRATPPRSPTRRRRPRSRAASRLPSPQSKR